MASILLIGEAASVSNWVDCLEGEGHRVETVSHSVSVRERFSGEEVDILIIDVLHPDHGEAMLIPQARAAWPHCKTIAITSNYSFRTSAIFEMGLWSPDQLLIKPVNLRILTATVAFLAAQRRTDDLMREIRSAQISDMRPPAQRAVRARGR